MASDGPGYAWLGFASTAVVAAGCTYVAYRALSTLYEEEDDAAPGAAALAGATAAAATQPSLPIRRTPPNPAAAASASKAASSSATASSSAAGASSSSSAGLLGVPLTSNGSGGISSSGYVTAKASKPSLASKGGIGKVCDYCKQPCQNGLPLRCSQCKAVVYCSPACSKKAWPEHKQTCKPPAKVAPPPTPPSTTLSSTSAAAATAAASSTNPPSAVPTYAQVVSTAAADDAATSGGGSASASADTKDASSVTADANGVSAPASAEVAGGTSLAAPAATSVRSATPVDGSSAVNANKGSAPTPASSELGAPKEDATAVEVDAKDASAAKDEPTPTSMEEMLAVYLRETASQHTNSLDAQFQNAVVLFISGEIRKALSQFQAVQAAARSTGVVDKEGEMYRWLGHSHNRLSNIPAAIKAFEEGVAFAEEHGMTRQGVECLSGLGCLYRGQNQPTQAVSYLRQALELVGTGPEAMDSRATVLCNLGAALMSTAPDEGLSCLTAACQIREDAVERLYDSGDKNGMATAVMEHASTLLNLASALYATGRYTLAKEAYEQALQVFEVIEDVDRMSKVLINLHNLSELQLKDQAEALKYRRKLTSFLSEHQQRTPDSTCSVCLSQLKLDKATEDAEDAILFLGCMHGIHDACFKKWSEHHQSPEGGGTICPTCRAPVPIFES